jgi:hypothetical protein
MYIPMLLRQYFPCVVFFEIIHKKKLLKYENHELKKNT